MPEKITIAADEPLHPVPRAVEIATKLRPHKSTMFRWMGRGIAGIRLPYLLVGGRRMCSPQAVRRWIEAVTAARARSADPTTGPTTDIERIERDMIADGW